MWLLTKLKKIREYNNTITPGKREYYCDLKGKVWFTENK